MIAAFHEKAGATPAFFMAGILPHALSPHAPLPDFCCMK
ncbi:hypothetical protein BN137_2032 [Cronobacter condimenti 1330]|uniref:Uncharacterized protein n=1 Tax=Cronobacter condimenti 1330 TaxID=1073999 RepID=K8AAB5_9ENTR|nr:hypothetical protein BN137_2032 [Cronobacter condimenti 1330]